jgi:hypothetical protein
MWIFKEVAAEISRGILKNVSHMMAQAAAEG